MSDKYPYGCPEHWLDQFDLYLAGKETSIGFHEALGTNPVLMRAADLAFKDQLRWLKEELAGKGPVYDRGWNDALEAAAKLFKGTRAEWDLDVPEDILSLKK